jgi:hypothetical protein
MSRGGKGKWNRLYRQITSFIPAQHRFHIQAGKKRSAACAQGGLSAVFITCIVNWNHSLMKNIHLKKRYEVMDMELSKLPLKKRTLAALEKQGITRSTQLTETAKSGLHRLKGVGPKTLEEVNQWLKTVEVK